MDNLPKKTYRERKRLWTGCLKQISKEKGLKFKSNYCYLIDKDIIYDSTFNISLTENKISGTLNFTPLSLSNIFWDITGLENNKLKPKSFRIDAVFKVRSISLWKYNILIQNVFKPKTELNLLIDQIINRIDQNKTNNINSYIDFLEKRIENSSEINAVYDEFNLVGLICAHISQGNMDRTEELIDFALQNEINCGFNFEGNSFFELTKKYIN